MVKGLLMGLSLFCGAALFGWTPPLTINSTMVKHYVTNDFTRISEFFTGRENTGGDTILRTDEAFRAGLYLVLKINRAVCDLGENADLTFKYILSDFKREKSQTFSLAPVAGWSRWIFIGVTGADYHGCGQTFLAWSVELNSNEENVVQESYLWKMGEKLEADCE